MIEWNPSPIAFEIGPLKLHWYGVLFMSGFIFGYFTLLKVTKKEKIPSEYFEKLLTYVLLGTVIGARLGHVLFYEPDKYFSDPLEIIAIWNGGLASHGGAIGVAIAVYLFSKKYKKFSLLEILDRLALVIPLAGTCIRLGNLMNSEIIGKPTDISFAFIFTSIDFYPRHPAQLYEAIIYAFIFCGLLLSYSKLVKKTGSLFGLMLTLIFSTRFFVEFLKENQVNFENSLPINMGQILSIPFVIVGVYFFLKSKRSN